MNNHKNLLKTLIDLLDGIVEVFLMCAIHPVLDLHARGDHAVDHVLRQLVHHHKNKAPKWMLKDDEFFTYFRVGLALPTIVCLSWGQSFLPAILVFVVHFTSFLERALGEHHVEHGTGDDKDDSMQEQAEEESFGKFLVLGFTRISVQMTCDVCTYAYSRFVDCIATIALLSNILISSLTLFSFPLLNTQRLYRLDRLTQYRVGHECIGRVSTRLLRVQWRTEVSRLPAQSLSFIAYQAQDTFIY